MIAAGGREALVEAGRGGQMEYSIVSLCQCLNLFNECCE